MIQTEIFNEHVKAYEAWYEKYPNVYLSEVAAIKEQLLKLPENINGIEVGLGTGRFSQPLGIKEGIEPSYEMGKKAMKRGIEVMEGVAERLPYGDLQFDFVLFVTICHLNKIKDAFSQAYRVLKPGGTIIIGFIDKDQHIAKLYEEKRDRSTFFRHATFYTVNRIEKLLKEAGFRNFEYNQTLFDTLEEIKEIQTPKQGFGEGSFVVVKAIKK
ncbi:MAG: class I SAM-dependent methyltransferase [Bacteroidetes bacterium]|nr:class I SAM-dependent methyltransferase [Bacteroidota bacterium]